MNVAEIVIETALAEWWDNRSMPQDRWHLVQNCGIREHSSMHLALRCWEKLPDHLRFLLVNHALSGKVLEFLPESSAEETL
jgi:hypothetical protein